MTDKKDYYVPKDSPVFPSRFDTRVRLRSLTLGLLEQEELDAHLEALPDESENADFVDFNSVVEGDEVEEVSAEASEEVSAGDAEISFDDAAIGGIVEPAPEASIVPPAEPTTETPATETAGAQEAAAEIPGAEIVPPLSEEDVPKTHESVIPKVIPPASSPTDGSDFN